MQEIPCRDTDPDPYTAMSDKEEDRESPVAFTINFGEGSSSNMEKSKKLERFAMRSSQRKPRSPRLDIKQTNICSTSSTKGSVTKARGGLLSAARGGPGSKSYLRQKSDLESERQKELVNRRLTTIISPGKEVIDFSGEKSKSEDEKKRRNQDKDSHRRASSVLSPTERDNFSSHEVPKYEDEYNEDSFECDSEDEDTENNNISDKLEKEGSTPSETGTYTVDKENEELIFEDTRDKLESFVEKSSKKSSYVEEWANKHAFPQGGSDHLGDCEVGGKTVSPKGTKSSLTSNKSRRKLPATPNSQPTRSPDVLTFSPDSEPGSSLSPPGILPDDLADSDEDESSYVTHTQHLVDVMEARINQKTVHQKTIAASKQVTTKSKIARRVKSSGSSKSTTSEQNNDQGDQTAMEAWKRRKNYDPMAAAGKKKAGVDQAPRKLSTSSLRSGAGTNSVRGEQPGSGGGKESAPSSAKSRSSDSSGYLSRNEGGQLSGRSKFSGTSNQASKTAPGPLRKLVHTNSSSSLQIHSSRSSSSLTSKEAEFQAWKRRKNYDPLKSSGARKTSNPSSVISPVDGVNSSHQSKSAYSPSPTDCKPSPLLRPGREMTQSLVTSGGCKKPGKGSLPIHRSNSFHYGRNKVEGSFVTSEEESGDDYGSGYDSTSATEVLRGPRSLRTLPQHVSNEFYLDDDELIMPIPAHSNSHTRLNERSMYGSKSLSPQVSPSKSGRGSKLEALDNLVISTIYNVSSKLCSASSLALRKASSVFPDQGEEQASTVETVLYLLDDVDMPSTPAKKTSRELSGTLRNLKKVEQALDMLNKVLELEDEDTQ